LAACFAVRAGGARFPASSSLGRTLLLAGASILPSLAAAQAQDAAASAWTSLRQTEISGSLMYFQRNRERYRIDEDRFGVNLRHQTLQGKIDLSTPYFLDGSLGVDMGVFATTDLGNSAGAPDHEISFFPWRTPWSPDWSRRDARGGFSLYRAHLKLRRATGDGLWWGKLGYFQPQGPGVLGVNWSLMPGTFVGAESGIDRGAFSLAGAYVTRYKAPWFKRAYAFLDDEKRDAGPLWSLGLRYTPQPGVSAEVAYGEAPGYLRSGHLKLKYERDGRYLSYQLYLMGDRDDSGSLNDHYDGAWASQHYLAFARTFSPWLFKAEFTHTRAPSSAPWHRGYFAYRLSGWYGGVKGAYEPWWDNRSDWNHNRESAAFLSLSRKLDDWGLPGLTAGVSAARGWGGKVYGVSETLREKAWSVDLACAVTSGVLKDATLSLHYTHYDNRTRQPSWTGFKNLFQDERDLKVLLTVPWKL
jgi:hypothetical protein